MSLNRSIFSRLSISVHLGIPQETSLSVGPAKISRNLNSNCAHMSHGVEAAAYRETVCISWDKRSHICQGVTPLQVGHTPPCIPLVA